MNLKQILLALTAMTVGIHAADQENDDKKLGTRDASASCAGLV